MANIDRIPPYDIRDLKLLRSKPVFTNFGDEKFRDHLELHIYSGENVLESKYNVDSWSSKTSDTKNLAPSVVLNIHGDIRGMGYNTGTVRLKYNFIRCLVGDPTATLFKAPFISPIIVPAPTAVL